MTDNLDTAWRKYRGDGGALDYTQWAAIFEAGYRAGRENPGRNRKTDDWGDAPIPQEALDLPSGIQTERRYRDFI